jgi:rhodanese-related sulfurtransferase
MSFKVLLSALVLHLGLSAQAMTLERVGSDLYATGPTVGEDFIAFRQAFAQGGIERLILVNGPGGDLWTGMQVARMVRDAKIKTVVSGFCMSACSLIFMGGKERAFGTGHLPRATLIGIHGAHDLHTKAVRPDLMPQMYALYRQTMGDRFDSEVINQALYQIKEPSGFLRLREIERNNEKDRTPWFCPTGQTPVDQCQQHAGKDAHSLGVVTQTRTELLELPASMRIALGFFGRPLTAPSIDLQARADTWVQTLCAGRPMCQSAAQGVMQTYLKSNPNKALAMGWNKPGYGFRFGDDNPGVSMLRALYNCNHARNNPKLCRLLAVNDHELLPFYEDIDGQTSGLLAQLKTPDAQQSQQERDEPGGRAPKELRQNDQLTGMTPGALEGIERWNTAEMVQALRQPQPPVLIDVAVAGPMLPGALHFVRGGLAFKEPSVDAAYAERFRHMLAAAAPDLNQPLVFYCEGSASWLAVNAAMRARQLGYTQVKWYRGGLQAWSQTSLPATGRVPVAVIH